MIHTTYVTSVNYGIGLTEADILELLRDFECGDRCQLLVAIESVGATNVCYARTKEGTPVLNFTLEMDSKTTRSLDKIELMVAGRLLHV